MTSGRYQIQSAKRGVFRVRFVFAALSIVNAVWLLIMLYAWNQAEEMPGGKQVGEQGGRNLLIAIQAASVAVLLLGLWQAKKNPLPWAIMAAIFLTLSVLRGPGVLPVFFMLATWGAIPPILHLRRLVAQDPGAPDLEHLLQTSEGAVQRGRGRRKRAMRDAVRFSVGAAVAIVLLIGGLALYTRWRTNSISAPRREPTSYEQPDQAIDETQERFERAWDEPGWTALAALYPPRLDSRADRLQRRFELRDMESRPTLRHLETLATGDMKQTAFYDSIRGEVKVVFEHDAGGWSMVDLRLPSR